jgi:undecaprenyl diphosphate synthase
MAVTSKSSPEAFPDADADAIPEHICIIMDGNHRWAKARRLPGAAGHRAGAKRVRAIAEACADLGIKGLTLFAFSTENWQRPRGEVRLLIDLMRHVMENDLEELHRRDVRLRIIGDRSRFSDDIQQKMQECETLTENNATLDLAVAVNFGGRWDIVNAARALAESVQRGELDPADIDETSFAAHTSLGDLTNPDLLIRTGGDFRVSNFLLWDLAYTELYFTDVFWPDFDEACLHEAIETFAARNRRFGQRK